MWDDDKFWCRVDKTDGCWNWTGAINSTGYGSVSWQNRVVCAHRLAAYLVGLIDSPVAPKSKKGDGFILHTCDNRKCCNPSHFTTGTYSDNQLDAYRKSRRQPSRGALHVNAKLTPEAVRDVRLRYRAVGVIAAVAREFNVSERCVSSIIKGKTYVNVE